MPAPKKTLKTPLSPEVESLPSRLETALCLLDKTGTEVDERAGVGSGRVSRTLNRERIERLPLDAVIKMAKGLGVRPAWLAFGEEPMLDNYARVSTAPASEPPLLEARAKPPLLEARAEESVGKKRRRRSKRNRSQHR